MDGGQWTVDSWRLMVTVMVDRVACDFLQFIGVGKNNDGCYAWVMTNKKLSAGAAVSLQAIKYVCEARTPRTALSSINMMRLLR